jgi:hypothetical protein
MARRQIKRGTKPSEPPPAEDTTEDIQRQEQERQRQEHAARMERRLNDPEWRPLVEYVRKKLGDCFELHWEEVHYLVHGNVNPSPLPYTVRFTLATVLQVLSPLSPRLARRRLDDVLNGRKEKRERPTAERAKRFTAWAEEGKGPSEIARLWKRETGQVLRPETVRVYLYRLKHKG